MSVTLIALVLLLAVVAIVVWATVRRLGGIEAAEVEVAALDADLADRIPVSLHPVIDPAKCIGSAACVPACPEGKILRLHDGHAHLVQPESCIGHGVCARECPVGAISLVFGTATRGIDIPHVTGDFETNVDGIYIVGELGGMGLIRNAVAQGIGAVDHIAARKRTGALDLLVVGAGPAGLAAGLQARKRGLTFEIIDQAETIGGTIAQYPRRKIVMLGRLELPGFRQVPRGEMSKEALVALWEEACRDLDVGLGERLERVERLGDTVRVTSSRRVIEAGAVVLAIGRRGTPRRLGVPGEDLPHVAYSLREPDEWKGMALLIVGGGDSAIEAALQLSAVDGTAVALSYRGDRIFRAKPANRARLDAAVSSGEIELLLGTNVTRISVGRACLERNGEPLERAADQVFVFAGGVLPTGLLKSAGITMERKFGTR